METITQLFELIFHVDQVLGSFIENHGNWVYVLLFTIIFVETGLVVMPFLPGDSLLFIVGAFAATGALDYSSSCALLFTAAVAGDQLNYSIGKYFGPKVFQWENSRFFNKKAFAQANAFYDRYGGTTIIIARFMPFMRTFVPFVAGVAEMSRSKFTFFNVTGGFIWVVGVTAAGYFFGNIDWVQKNLSVIIWGLILVPGVLALFGAWKAGRKKTA